MRGESATVDSREIVLATRAITGAFHDIKAGYQAAKPNRYRRRRTDIPAQGAGADYHTRNDLAFYKVVEYARDYDRNDALVGQMIDRAVTNVNQDGFAYDPNTGDTGLDRELVLQMDAWASDPAQADAAGELTFPELMATALRAQYVDGDILALGLKSGHVQLVESHLIRTPADKRRGVVLGVHLGPRRKRVGYWVAPDNLDPNGPLLSSKSGMVEYATYDAAGRRQVFHVYNPKRPTQTRGITAFAPVFDIAGMVDDLNFANLVRAQVSACYAIFVKRELGFGGGGPAVQGERTTETQGDGSVRTIEDIAPGMKITGQPGEELTGFSPNVPNVEFFQHFKLLVTLLGVNLGLPLVMGLMDGSETNFSGWRGAVDQARTGFRRIQAGLIQRAYAPIGRWKTFQFAERDPAIRKIAKRSKIDLYAARWNAPAWKYIEPFKDCQADALRLSENLESPRRLYAESGKDYDDVTTEIVADRVAFVTKCIEGARGINQKYPEAGVTWQTLAFPKQAPAPLIDPNPEPAEPPAGKAD